MRTGRHGPRGRRSAGVTLLATLLFLALLVAALLLMLSAWSQIRLREKQDQLVWTGDKFREAIGRYYERSPDTDRRLPDRLEDLLEDPRFPGTQRYLRRILRDPMTGRTEWGIVKAPAGGIIGVYSLSNAAPVNSARNTPSGQVFAGAKHYSDVKFVYVPVDSVPGDAAERPPDGVKP